MLTPQAVRLDGRTLLQALAAAEQAGYTAQFAAQPGGVIRCFSCRRDSPAERVSLHGLQRIEGASDPASEAVVAALQCPHCAVLGTLIMGYGPGTPPEEGDALAALTDRRPETRSGET